MQRKYKLVVVMIVSLFLIGGASMAIIKGVEHLRFERQKRQKAELIKESKKEVRNQAKVRQKIALWVVQHYAGEEAIEKIGVSKIYTNGIFGSAGKSVAVIINGEEKNIIDGIHLDDDYIPKEPGARFENSDYKYSNKPLLNRDLNGVDVYYWRESNNGTDE